MKLEARKKGGDRTNPRNIIDTRITFDADEQLEAGDYKVVHSIECASGPEVTHGGGATAGRFLHYKSIETDADSDGDIDYSNTTIHTLMSEQGASGIKVVAKVTELSKLEDFNKTVRDWWELQQAEVIRLSEIHGPSDELEKQLLFWEDDNPMPEDDFSYLTELKSGTLFLEWDSDVDSNWV